MSIPYTLHLLTQASSKSTRLSSTKATAQTYMTKYQHQFCGGRVLSQNIKFCQNSNTQENVVPCTVVICKPHPQCSGCNLATQLKGQPRNTLETTAQHTAALSICTAVPTGYCDITLCTKQTMSRALSLRPTIGSAISGLGSTESAHSKHCIRHQTQTDSIMKAKGVGKQLWW